MDVVGERLRWGSREKVATEAFGNFRKTQGSMSTIRNERERGKGYFHQHMGSRAKRAKPSRFVPSCAHSRQEGLYMREIDGREIIFDCKEGWHVALSRCLGEREEGGRGLTRGQR